MACSPPCWRSRCQPRSSITSATAARSTEAPRPSGSAGASAAISMIPGGGAPGAFPRRGGRPVEPAGPAVEQEVLERQVVVVTVEQQGRALEAPAVLVDVGREGRHPVDPEVPRRYRLAEPLEERQHPPPQAGGDVAQRTRPG